VTARRPACAPHCPLSTSPANRCSGECGQIIGWVEGFKAISDLFCVAAGQFAGNNPALKEQINVITKDPYGTGWLYEVQGTPDSRCLEVHAYRDLLDKTIDRILAQQKGEDIK
jgi:glycine cleavage system H protein